jgi:putative FmdB family regulatory protein
MEVMQKISDKPLTRHPKCGGRLTKEWSRTGFQFKGSGWYVTDYASKAGSSKDGDEKESSSTKAETAETKSGESSKETAKEKEPAKTRKSTSK